MSEAAYTEKDLPELEQKMDDLDEQINTRFNQLLLDGVDYKDIDGALKPLRKQLNALSRIHRVLLPRPEKILTNISDYGDLMTMEAFIDTCECGGFIDYDGIGRYATETQESDIEILPSDITMGVYRKDFSHVVWFNR